MLPMQAGGHCGDGDFRELARPHSALLPENAQCWPLMPSKPQARGDIRGLRVALELPLLRCAANNQDSCAR